MIRSLLSIALLFFLGTLATADEPALKLEKGDHICLVGNALGERMQHDNWWETALQARFGDQELVVRNLCFPGDEPFERIRSKNFGEPDVHLKHSGATVVLYFFGYNESFNGDAGVGKFVANMQKLVEHTKSQDYSGKGPPRVVLISPIAFENVGDPNLPNGIEHNKRLETYTAALAKVAQATNVGFVDLFHPTLKLFEQHDERLTLNGAHLNDNGYHELAPMLMAGLFGKGPLGRGLLDKDTVRFDPALRAAIAEKNFHWWHRYRAVNGYSIYGDRGKAGSDGTYDNTAVMERERAILDQMTANRDQRVWQIAQGKPVTGPIDDNNTLPFINPKSNVGDPNDKQAKQGKLGSLDYRKALEQQKMFKLAPGYEINLVACEEDFPELANPVAIQFDNRGRLWVATMASYPQWQPKTPMNDKLLIFEDHNSDGRADECKVFADGLHQPTGFEIGHGGAYISQQPDVYFMQDLDGDDRADTRVRQLVGFDSADSHHGLAAFKWGPDGGLYFQEGTFKFSQVESPYGLTRLHEGGIWRYDPRTEKFSVHVSLAFANPWGHVFDRWGQDFIGDASPGFGYWAAPISGHIEYPAKHPGGSQHKRVASTSGGDPNYNFPTFYAKRTRPLAGCEILTSRHFPPEVQGNWLVTNCIGDRAVLNHEVREDGSGFTGKEVEPIISCDDGNFRPVDVQVAPDGSLYVVDWHNALIGHLQHNLRDPNRDHIHGRIWRITCKDRPLLKPAKIAGEPIPALLELLKEPENNTRYRARRELAERPSADVVAALTTWVAALDKSDEQYEHNALEALWLYQTHNVVREDLLKQLLNAKDHRARAAATRALSFELDRVPHAMKLLGACVTDKHPRVRLEGVRAPSFYANSPLRTQALEVALDALNSETDTYLEYALQETLRVLDPTAAGTAPKTHDHQHATPAATGPKPLVFLDKSPRAIEFQLDRLDNERLLQAERRTDDAKFAPVYMAILTRAGMSPQYCEEALEALVTLNHSQPVTELLAALKTLDGDDRQAQRTAKQLATLLLKQPPSVLNASAKSLEELAGSNVASLRPIGYAGLIVAGQPDTAWSRATRDSTARNQTSTLDWLAAVALVPRPKMRSELRDEIVGLLAGSQPIEVRAAAIEALASVPTQQDDTFRRVAPTVAHGKLRTSAVRTLLRVPTDQRDPAVSAKLVDALVTYAEATPPARRTTDEFIDAMQLADQLLASVPLDAAHAYRDRLRAVAVRVVRIHTVEEEMRYDTPYFTVEAGRPVQIVLQNEDLMPHNLVITANGALQEVAETGGAMGPVPGFQNKLYVPKSDKVLFATNMVPAGGQERLTFTAPKEPGEYPFVCTFPRHWMRMYGVMVVVPDLEAWTRNPTKPKDPIGSNRSFVQSWTVDDFKDGLDEGLRGRTPEIGRKLFAEATCIQCHKVCGQGGAVGPELNTLFTRWKGDKLAVLREMFEPSHRIDPKYAVHIVVTDSGKVITGIVTAEDATSVSILDNPEAKQPVVLQRSSIEEMVKTSTSMMPKALLDRFTKDEVLEILAFLQGLKGATP